MSSSGEVRKYIVNPYQMAATNGRYYLIANYDRYTNISHYRVDKISEMSRVTQGVRLINLREGQKVSSISVVDREKEEDVSCESVDLLNENTESFENIQEDINTSNN